jgi:hypothetical protein
MDADRSLLDYLPSELRIELSHFYDWNVAWETITMIPLRHWPDPVVQWGDMPKVTKELVFCLALPRMFRVACDVTRYTGVRVMVARGAYEPAQESEVPVGARRVGEFWVYVEEVERFLDRGRGDDRLVQMVSAGRGRPALVRIGDRFVFGRELPMVYGQVLESKLRMLVEEAKRS